MLQLSKSTYSAVFAASLSAVFGAPAAFADVTNADVWNTWRGYMEGMGYEISASEQAVGSTLTVTGITLSAPSAEGIDQMSVIMPDMTMTEQGDGKVRVTLAPENQITIKVVPTDSETVEANIKYVHDGFDMMVSGDAAKLDYSYSANSLTASLLNLVVDGTSLGTDIASGTISLADVSGTSSVTTASPRQASEAINTGAITYEMNFNDPDSDAVAKINGAMEGLTFASDSVIPTTGANMQDMNAMLVAGFSMTGDLQYRGGSMDLSFNGRDGAGTAQTSSSTGTLGFTMSSDGIGYNIGQTDLAVNALMPDVPLPIVMNMAESKMNFAMPVQKSDVEQDFALGFTLGDFTVSDMIWGMVDPSAQLPRDPATLALDLTGKAKVLFDMFDPDQAAALASSGAQPGELNALTLKNLLVDAVGARLTGNGDFTFDNSDLVTFGGMPKPTGAVDMKLVGGNGLIDKLVAMGLLPEQQAMGARMMMGLFAVAGAEPDTLTSKIEINDEGHILANGQRIQ